MSLLFRALKTMLVIAVVVAGAAGFWLNQHINNYGKTAATVPQEITYDLQRGTSFLGMLHQLEQLGVIESVWKLRLYARFNDEVHDIKSGEYRLMPGESYDDLLQKFSQGNVIQRQVTLVEGHRLSDYLLVLASSDELQHELGEKSYGDIAELLGIKGANPEGWFFPDTYSFTKGTSDLDILKRSYQRMQSVLEEEWQSKSENLPIKSPYEALILASIVEKETGAPEERGQIAGVFTRRLEKGMRLQTDPTVIYGMGDAYKGNIRRSDLNRMTPYNTYRIQGLPPTPIANPGREAIHASLNPEAGNTLYFVAKGDGRHYFSANLSEHNKAVRQYQLKRSENYRSSPAAEGE